MVSIFGIVPQYKCVCATNFSGSSCEINLNTQCMPYTCFNHGNCSNDPITNRTFCTCQPLYTGNRCESSYNPCFNANGSSVCLNSALCYIDMNKPPNYYQCRCPPGVTGSNCEYVLFTTPLPTLVPLPNTTASYTTVSPAVCEDRDSAACAYYAKSNFCDYIYFLNQYEMSVPDYCPKSCNICNLCKDSQRNCLVWASFNLCYRLASVYPHPCRKSCKLC